MALLTLTVGKYSTIHNCFKNVVMLFSAFVCLVFAHGIIELFFLVHFLPESLFPGWKDPSQISSLYLSQKWCWCFWLFTSALPGGLLSSRTHLISSPAGSVLEFCFPSKICEETACSFLDNLSLVLSELSTLLDFHFLQSFFFPPLC